MIGSLAAAPIADRFGRTSPMRAWSTLCIFGIAIQLLLLVYSESRWYQVAIGRLVAGIPVGALSSMAPMYLSESAPRHIRGAMVG